MNLQLNMSDIDMPLSRCQVFDMDNLFIQKRCSIGREACLCLKLEYTNVEADQIYVLNWFSPWI